MSGYPLLESIDRPNDIRDLDEEQLPELAAEIRRFLIEKVSVTGGHLASNLGVVELTIALHRFLHFPEDKLIWDVGHQSYTHKLLTGRREGFDELRTLGGISGFPNRQENDCDAFNTGHSSTSISAGLGLAWARDLAGEDYTVVSVIGDGSLTGGMAFEALNNASRLKSNFIIIVNDNNMSISRNVGGVSRMLGSLRTDPKYDQLKKNVRSNLSRLPGGSRLASRISNTKASLKQLVIPGMIFEDMDLTYLGPIDGYNIPQMLEAFRDARRLDRAVVIHVKTRKGKGYAPAERAPEMFHGVNAFDVDTGAPVKKKKDPTWSDVFSRAICALAEEDPKVCAVTAAMAPGVGLSRFRHKYPDRFFDVGIAEQHAVTFSAGLASGGQKPYFAVYSSFLQRAYDQIICDICQQDLDVTLCIDRAGLVGRDGETHQGLLDLSYLLSIPNMSIFAPKNAWELEAVIRFSAEFEGPFAIRYPRGTAFAGLEEHKEEIRYGKSEMLFRGRGLALIAVGSMVETACAVREVLEAEGHSVTVVNARFVRPLDREMLHALAAGHHTVVTMEENCLAGGFGEHLAAVCSEESIPLRVIPAAIPNHYVEHGDVAALKAACGIDRDGILRLIRREVRFPESETGLPESEAGSAEKDVCPAESESHIPEGKEE